MTLVAHDTAWLASLSLPQLEQELCLAASRLAAVHLAEAHDGWPAICHECNVTHREDLLHIAHREGCRTGTVARVLYELANRQVHPTPQRKETTQDDSKGTAVSREMRPSPPFLLRPNALPGLYGEPWAMDEDGTLFDAGGNTVMDPVGCELIEPDDRRALERAMLCVNFCDGIAARDLQRVGGAM